MVPISKLHAAPRRRTPARTRYAILTRSGMTVHAPRERVVRIVLRPMPPRG